MVIDKLYGVVNEIKYNHRPTLRGHGLQLTFLLFQLLHPTESVGLNGAAWRLFIDKSTRLVALDIVNYEVFIGGGEVHPTIFGKREFEIAV